MCTVPLDHCSCNNNLLDYCVKEDKYVGGRFLPILANLKYSYFILELDSVLVFCQEMVTKYLGIFDSVKSGSV